MDALKMIPYIVLTLCISGVIAGASAIVLSQFRATTTDANALAVIDNATEGVQTVAEQFPTVGIISVLVIIISLLAGVFVYMRYFG